MRFYLRRVYLNTGGYEYGRFGQYWGTGMPLYRYESEDGEKYDYIRAYNRQDAKDIIVRSFPGATFFN